MDIWDDTVWHARQISPIILLDPDQSPLTIMPQHMSAICPTTWEAPHTTRNDLP
jgi:hypothetical protein